MRMGPTSAVSRIAEQIAQGNLPDVVDEIEMLEMTTDMLLRVADSFNRRLKNLNGGELLPRVEKNSAQKLLMYLLESKGCPTKDIFPYMFHVSAIYRHLLIKEKLTMIEAGERLLKLHDSWSVREASGDLTILRTNLYAYPWNFLRENHGSLKPVENLKIVGQSLRWLIRQGEKSFSNASHKMHQMSHIVTACESFDAVEKFIKQIMYDAREVWLEDLLPQSWEQNAVQFDGVFNFTICAIRYALYFGETEKAKQIWKEILESFSLYFIPDVAVLLEKACHNFYVFASYLSDQETFRNNATVEDDVMVIASQISKLVENSKIPGARLMLSYGFLQGICSLLHSLMREPRNWYYNDKSREFDRLISALFKLNYIMHTASPHADLPHLDQKRRDLEVSTYFIIFRLVSEFINSQKEVTFTVKMVTEKSFDGLKRLINSGTNTKESLNDLCNKINFYGGQIGSALVRVKDFEGGLKMLNLAFDLVEKVQNEMSCDSTTVEPTQMVYTIADAYNQSKNFDAGMQSLAETLYKYPILLESHRQPTSVDVLEPISWYNWSYHWISLKRNAANADSRSLMRKTVVDYLMTNKVYSSSLVNDGKKQLLKMLHFEFNSYFATKSAVADGLIGVGEALEAHGTGPVDVILGLLSQGIGFWWGDLADIEQAISLFRDALLLTEQEAQKCPDSSEMLLCAALCHAWLAFGHLRKFQETSVTELEVIKNYETARNPKKFTAGDDERLLARVIPAVSSLCIEDEYVVASHLSRTVSILYDMSTVFATELRVYIDRVGSAVSITTLKLTLNVLNALGSKEVALRCCFVAKTLAELYHRSHLTVTALSQIMRACPSMEPTLSGSLQKLRETVMSRQGPNSVRNHGVYAVYFMKAVMARAVACAQAKRYQGALSALAEIFEYRRSVEVFDVGHHILGEAYFYLAELKLLEVDCDLDFSEIPKYLRYITPVGLASKGYKILASVARSPQPTESGWNDLFHNYDLLFTIMDVSDKALKHYTLCGKLKEARCVAADFIYFAQQMALVSRTIDLIIPLAEMDARSRNFDSCQQKIDCVISMLKGPIVGTDKSLDSRKVLDTSKKLQVSKEFIKAIMEDGKETWDVTPVSLPEHTFGVYGPPPARINDSPTILEPRKMKRIIYLHHALNCSCYICTHPKIIPNVIKFYCLQARLASCAKKTLDSGKILEASNRYHLKAMLRLLNNWDYLKCNFTEFMTPAEASELLQTLYKDFFLQPGITSQMTKLEMMPAMDVKESIPCYNQIVEALKLSSCDVSVHLSIPFEVLLSGIFNAAFSRSPNSIRLGAIRENLDDVDQSKDELFPDAHSPEPSKQIPSAYFKILPKRARAKGLFSDSDEDENLPEKEVLDVSQTNKKIALPFKLDDMDDDDDNNDDDEDDEVKDGMEVSMGDIKDNDDSVIIIKQTGPSRNTRSRVHRNAS